MDSKGGDVVAIQGIGGLGHLASELFSTEVQVEAED